MSDLEKQGIINNELEIFFPRITLKNDLSIIA
jgi:hypothetical protein